jgi:hypothetical protein
MPECEDPAELLDVQVDKLSRARSLVALGGSGGESLERLPSPIRLSTAETVESAIRKHLGRSLQRSYAGA